MEELKRTKRITIGVFVFLAILIIGFFTVKRPTEIYRLTPQQMNDDLILVYQITPEEVVQFFTDSTRTAFVDLRSIYDFEKGHLDHAINIPIPNLLDTENKQKFEQWKKDSVLVILYGNDQLQANSPWMMMYQLGYTNTRVLMGGKTYFDQFMASELDEDATFETEEPAYDFKAVIAEGSSGNDAMAAPAPKKAVVVQKKKKKAAEGGC